MMKLAIKQITKKEFDITNHITLFSKKGYDNYFIEISCPSIKYKLAWQSNIIFPHFILLDDESLLIGIDLNFAIVDLKSGLILMNEVLNYYYFDCKINKDFIYVITEIEIIRINKFTFKIDNNYYLPEVFQEIIFLKNEIIIKCIDDQIINISEK